MSLVFIDHVSNKDETNHVMSLYSRLCMPSLSLITWWSKIFSNFPDCVMADSRETPDNENYIACTRVIHHTWSNNELLRARRSMNIWIIKNWLLSRDDESLKGKRLWKLGKKRNSAWSLVIHKEILTNTKEGQTPTDTVSLFTPYVIKCTISSKVKIHNTFEHNYGEINAVRMAVLR